MIGITSITDQHTLHLPRILCLHGGGTNARIFRAQCRVLEKSLKPYFRFCYAQAPFSSKPGPDVVSVYKEWAPFRAWFRLDHDVEFISQELVASLRRAMDEDDRKGATGEFVGLLGFSQGAKICGSLLLAQQNWEADLGPDMMPQWKFAILLAGRGPLVPATPENAESIVRRTVPSKSRVAFPTIHVHGLRDPALNLHQKYLREHFEPRQTLLVEWDGEHRMPIKTKDVAVVMNAMISMAI